MEARIEKAGKNMATSHYRVAKFKLQEINTDFKLERLKHGEIVKPAFKYIIDFKLERLKHGEIVKPAFKNIIDYLMNNLKIKMTSITTKNNNVKSLGPTFRTASSTRYHSHRRFQCCLASRYLRLLKGITDPRQWLNFFLQFFQIASIAGKKLSWFNNIMVNFMQVFGFNYGVEGKVVFRNKRCYYLQLRRILLQGLGKDKQSSVTVLTVDCKRTENILLLREIPCGPPLNLH